MVHYMFAATIKMAVEFLYIISLSTYLNNIIAVIYSLVLLRVDFFVIKKTINTWESVLMSLYQLA